MSQDPNQERKQQEDLNIPKKTQAEPSKEDLEASKSVAEAEQQGQHMGFEWIHFEPGKPFEGSRARAVDEWEVTKFERDAKKDIKRAATESDRFSAKKAEAQVRIDLEREARAAEARAQKQAEEIESAAQTAEKEILAQIEDGRTKGKCVQSEVDLRRDDIDENDPEIKKKIKEAKQLFELLHPAFTVNVRHELLNMEVPDPMTMYDPKFQERVFKRLAGISKDLRISGLVLAQAVDIAQDSTLYNVMEFMGDDDSNEATNIRRMILDRVPYEWYMHSVMLNSLKGVHSENAWNIRESLYNALENCKGKKNYYDDTIGRKLLENIEGDNSDRAEKFREKLKGYEKVAVA